MSKRQEIKVRRRRQQLRSRLFTVALVTGGALLLAFAFITYLAQSDNPPSVAVTPVATHTFAVPTDWTSVGDPAAPVRMDAWEDFLCPACQSYTLQTEPLVFANYVETGLVYYTFHFFPLEGHGREAIQSAHAAACAAEQGRFFDMHNSIFVNFSGSFGSLADPVLLALAEKIGLDMDAFGECFDEQRYAERINEDFLAGRAAGVTGTPSIFVAGRLVQNAAGLQYIPGYEDIASAIEAALAGDQ